MKQDQIILAIDYGMKNVGIAMATSSIAEPLEVIKMETALEKIASIIDEKRITLVLMGISEGKMAVLTRDFAKKIQLRTRVEVKFWDETLSSQETRKLTAAALMKRKKREGKQDHFVAARILQDYLDTMLV